MKFNFLLSKYLTIQFLGDCVKTDFLTVMIDDRAFKVNFLNVFYFLYLKYNLFFIGITEETFDSILAKNGKIIFLNNKNNVTIVKILIKT